MIDASTIPAATSMEAAWRRWVLWAGMLACVAGVLYHQLWQGWASGRFAELVLLAAASLVLAWLAGRVLPARLDSPMPTRLTVVWLGALFFFSGILPTLATLLFLAAATALGALLAWRDASALQCANGLVNSTYPLRLPCLLVKTGYSLDPQFHVSALGVGADPRGSLWTELFRCEEIRHVILREDTHTPVLDAAVAGFGAMQQARIGEASWWLLPAEPPTPSRSP